MTKRMNRISRKQERRERAIQRIYNRYHGAPDVMHGNIKETRAGITLANTLQNMQDDAPKTNRRTKRNRSARGKFQR